MSDFNNIINDFLTKLKKNNTVDKSEIYRNCKYSVSKIVEACAEPFDKLGVAQKTFAKYFNDESSKYYHMSIDDILDEWKRKADVGIYNGKALDSYIELVYENNSIDILEKYKSSLTDAAKKKCSVFDLFFKKYKEQLNFLTRELFLYDYELGVVGRFDALFFKNDKLILIDWKNTEEIRTENRFQKLKGPLYEYDDCELNKYTIQLYIYTYILRKIYNLTNVNIVPLLVQIGLDDYKVYSPKIPYSDKLVEDIIDYTTTIIKK